MGQEINHVRFKAREFERFYEKLQEETALLAQLIQNKRCSQKDPVAGFEIEAWLVDEAMRPAPFNKRYLAALNDPLAGPELAKFNVELNNSPVKLENQALSRLNQDLNVIWSKACKAAESLGLHLLMIGTLPTLERSSLNLRNMSELNRYRALNEQILRLRGEPIHLDINGNQHLVLEHDDVMLESAATSFQIHLQAPLDRAHILYNAAIMASAATVAVSANSPYLFGMDLWSETRIPLFEQSIGTGGYEGAAHGPLRRVSFGSDYARRSLAECFEENLEHFPILLPILYNSRAEAFEHLRLHNGTIWRWNRPLVGFDEDGTPHLRIEHRVIPAGPSIVDSIANAAFFYGLAENLSLEERQPVIPFSQAKDNFYQAARYGLQAHTVWIDEEKCRLQNLILNELIPRAREGLNHLNIARSDTEKYLNIIYERASSGLTGSEWQRRFMAGRQADFKTMTSAYLQNQLSGRPVHEWALC